MAIEGTGQGFFTAKGNIKSDGLKSPSSTKTPTPAPTSGTDVKQAAANTTQSGISDAVVSKINSTISRMNVGNTGFDKGVREMVEGAVAAGQRKKAGAGQASTPNTTAASQTSVKGGTYQNSVMAANKPAAAAPATPPADTAEKGKKAEKSEPPRSERAEANQEKKAVGGSFQNELIAAAKKAAEAEKAKASGAADKKEAAAPAPSADTAQAPAQGGEQPAAAVEPGKEFVA